MTRAHSIDCATRTPFTVSLRLLQAQADFSPYHIAWGTPSIPPNFFLPPQHPRSSSTAKKLNMDTVDRATDSRTRAQREQPRSKTDEPDVPQSSEGSTIGDPCVPRDWGFLKPGDVSGRPISAEYRTPQASFKGRQRRSVGVVLGAEAEAQERQPLLAYTVAEYRKSLKDIASATNTPFSTATYESRSPTKTPKVSASHLSQSSCCYHLSMQSQSADNRVPLVNLGTSIVPEKGVATGKTCRTHQFEDHLGSDSTLAGFGDLLHSSDPALSPETEGRRQHMKNASEDVLNNNSNFVNSGESSNHSCEESSPLPSDISSPPPCTDSFDTDVLSSEATPSSESMGNTGDDMSPEVNAPSVEAERRGRLLKQENTRTEQYVVSVWNRSSSPTRQNHPASDNFKVPFPVDPVKPKCSAGIMTQTSDTARMLLPRSKSSSHKPLAQHCLVEARLPKLRRSRTSESISSKSQAQQQLMSVGSLTDVSVAGSSASRMSLAWDHEFTASGHSRCTNDSLTWEDDPYLQ